jgi:hypothetical protein
VRHSCVKGASPRTKAKEKGKVQATAKTKESAKKEGQGISKRRRAHQGKGRLTSMGYQAHLQGTPKHPSVVVIVPGSLVYVFLVNFALSSSIYIYLQTGFPEGLLPWVMLTKNTCVLNFMHA